jgi:hypothetical protein
MDLPGYYLKPAFEHGRVELIDNVPVVLIELRLVIPGFAFHLRDLLNPGFKNLEVMLRYNRLPEYAVEFFESLCGLHLLSEIHVYNYF